MSSVVLFFTILGSMYLVVLAIGILQMLDAWTVRKRAREELRLMDERLERKWGLKLR